MKITADVALAVALAVMVTCAAEAEPSVVQTGVTVYDKARAYPCYVLYAGADEVTHLVDMVGTEVHRNDKVLWEWGTQAPGGAARQHHDWQRLPNGDTAVLVNIGRVIPDFGPRQMLD